MTNPWETIPLQDYETHMSLASVMQLQAMNAIMKEQLYMYPAATVMILGVAGGNGLEHIDPARLKRVYGVDVNPAYLAVCQERYPQLSGTLEYLQVNLLETPGVLPPAELVIANLLVEYIGYDCFQRVLDAVRPRYVSCVIQINTNEGFVSDSPYLHVFDPLEGVHHQMEEAALRRTMEDIGYGLVTASPWPLPNGKKLVRLDFAKAEPRPAPR